MRKSLYAKYHFGEIKWEKNAFSQRVLFWSQRQTRIITFANDDFCEIAEYKREELLGKPHNIVRHPDMPKAAFKDLWDTIKAGKVWTGLVKNATKEGDYYWVYATVYPMISCGSKKGYMSCRRMATRDKIKKAEELYKTMR